MNRRKVGGSAKRILQTLGTRQPRVDNAMVKALARAFRWRKLLDTGVHATLEDLARAQGIVPSYVSRVLRLTLLAPEIVEVLSDNHPDRRRQPSWPQTSGEGRA